MIFIRFYLSLSAIFFPFLLFADTLTPNIELKTSYILKNQPLTTEQVSEADPAQVNPHLQKWIVTRKLEFLGLTTFVIDSAQFGVRIAALNGVTEGLIRPTGPWYRPWSEFPCEKLPQFEFSTSIGVQYAAVEASRLWSDLLEQEKWSLALLLSRVRASSEKGARSEGLRIYQEWFDRLDFQWRRRVREAARMEEWKFYLQESSALGICKQKHLSLPSVSAKFQMESVSTGPAPQISQLLARAPVKLWNGLFSVRLNLKIGDRILNGRFLIDSGARKSIISPTWLENQGIYSAFIQRSKVLSQHVTWSGQWPLEGRLAPQAHVDAVEISGFKLPLYEFLISETDFFNSPNFIGSCCDGVLGVDFLKLFPIEFHSQAPAEIRIWPQKNFHWSEVTPWVEVSISENETLVSSCLLTSDTGLKKKVLRGVQWATGLDGSLWIHAPWQAELKSNASKKGSLFCDSIGIAQNFLIQFPEILGESPLSTRMPAISIGMQLLSRGNFTFDLPHGRLWFSKEALGQGEHKNHSGLQVEYILQAGERVLRVKEIQRGSPAYSLVQKGLKVGSILTQIDQQAAEDLDLWEVNRRLAGDAGSIVSLQWRTKVGLKMAPLVIE